MVYMVEHPNKRMKVDTDRIARRFLDGKDLYVHPFTCEVRDELIRFLEQEGFCCRADSIWTRQSILESVFPLKIGLNGKSISCLGNVTCAAAAAGSGLVMSSREFYLLYSLYLENNRGHISR